MIRAFLILSLLQLVAFWKILPRMGFPPWLAIMASIPLVNLILFYYLAFLRGDGGTAKATRNSDNVRRHSPRVARHEHTPRTQTWLARTHPIPAWTSTTSIARRSIPTARSARYA
jgi:hypothetical protein